MKFALISIDKPLLVYATAKTEEEIRKAMRNYPLTQLGAVEDDVDIGNEVTPLAQVVFFRKE